LAETAKKPTSNRSVKERRNTFFRVLDSVLSLSHQKEVNRIEQLKEIIRARGGNPEEVLSKDAMFRDNITERQEEAQNHQLSILAGNLKQIIRKEATE